MYRILCRGKRTDNISVLETLIDDEADARMLVNEFMHQHGSVLTWWYQPAADPVPDGAFVIGPETQMFDEQNSDLETAYKDPLYDADDEEE